MLRAHVGLHRRDVKTIARKHDHARVGNARGVAFDRFDRLQAAFFRGDDQRRRGDAR
jgi:hypothetical protein